MERATTEDGEAAGRNDVIFCVGAGRPRKGGIMCD